jgi:hypothetical protein
MKGRAVARARAIVEHGASFVQSELGEPVASTYATVLSSPQAPLFGKHASEEHSEPI